MNLKKPRILLLMLLALWAGSLLSQKNEWFIGFAVNPQHSLILNENDKIAFESYPSNLNSVQNDNGEVVIPNSIRASFLIGHSFSKSFKLETQIAYSFQQQKYLRRPHRTGGGSFSMRNNFNYAKLGLIPIYRFELNDVMGLEVGAGPQLSYLVSYLEERVHHPNDGSGVTNTFSVEQQTITHSNGNKSPLSQPIFNQFTLEGRAIVGLSWSYDDKKHFFFRFTSDHSLMDIENKSSIIEAKGETYYERYHSPWKWNFGVQPDEDCPDCSSTRPPSYNFTAGISFGMRFYL